MIQQLNVPTKPSPISLATYARRRGVSTQAVSKAITAGRLRESIIVIGNQPKIADAELADREWEANTRPRIDYQPPDGAKVEGLPDLKVSRALREAAAARREAALADIAELEAAEKKGELVSVAAARADVIDKFTVVKTRILGVPSRIAQRLPKLAAAVVPVLDELLREALEELSIEADDSDDEPDGDDEDE